MSCTFKMFGELKQYLLYRLQAYWVEIVCTELTLYTQKTHILVLFFYPRHVSSNSFWDLKSYLHHGVRIISEKKFLRLCKLISTLFFFFCETNFFSWKSFVFCLNFASTNRDACSFKCCLHIYFFLCLFVFNEKYINYIPPH